MYFWWLNTLINDVRHIHRTDTGKGPARLQSFLKHDIPACLQAEQQSEGKARVKPMYADIGVFVEGVMKDAKFLFPNIHSNKDVLVHVMNTLCKQDS